MKATATASMFSRLSSAATARTAASSSARRTVPLTSTRSGTVKRRRRGTSGFGLSMKTSYWSQRPSSAISITSRKPSVATSAVLAPLRSMMAFVASVVPCTNTATSAKARPAWRRTIRVPATTASSGPRGVVSTLVVKCSPPASITTSVKVPPMSTARRARVIGEGPCHEMSGHLLPRIRVPFKGPQGSPGRPAQADAPGIEAFAAPGQRGAGVDEPAADAMAVDRDAGELVAEGVHLAGRRDPDLAAGEDAPQRAARLTPAQPLHDALAAARPRRADSEDLIAVVADPEPRAGDDGDVLRADDARLEGGRRRRLRSRRRRRRRRHRRRGGRLGEDERGRDRPGERGDDESRKEPFMPHVAALEDSRSR